MNAAVWSTKPDAGVMTTSPHTAPLPAAGRRGGEAQPAIGRSGRPVGGSGVRVA